MAVGPPTDQQTIECYHCGRAQEVARRAMTITCRHCSKRLNVEDRKVKGYEAVRAIETIGSVVVDKRGSAICDRILCGSLIARGKVRGAVTSRGPVLVGPDAELKGDVTAPSIAVGAGAVLHGKYRIGQTDDASGGRP